jgi:hypothetical protein
MLDPRGAKLACQRAVPPLTAVIITLEDDPDPARTIGGVAFADEVLVIEAGADAPATSSDTVRGTRVLKHALGRDGPTTRWAVAEARHDWVLYLQAGEEVTPDLAVAIRTLLARGDPPCAAYHLEVATVFMGRPLHGRTIGLRTEIRLFDRRKVRWGGAPALAQVVASGEVGRLPGAVQRRAVRNVSDGIARMNTQSTAAAAGIAMGGRSPGGFALVAGTARQFLCTYVRDGNFRNGFPGLAWSCLQAFGSAMTLMKAREVVAEDAPGAGTSRDPR